MTQNGLTVVTPILNGQTDKLEQVLLSIGNDIQGNTLVRFPDMGSLHFACWVILRKGATAFADELVLELNYDADGRDPDGILRELIRHGAPGLSAIYTLCEGCPAGATANPTSFIAYLKQHVVPIAGFYVGCRGQSLASIRNAADIRAACEVMLDSPEGACLRSKPLRDIRAAIQEFVGANPSLRPVQSTVPLKETAEHAAHSNNLVKATLVLLGIVTAAPLISLLLHWWLPAWLAMALLVPLPLTLFLLVFAIVLRVHEIRDAAIVRPLEGVVDQRVAGKEDVFDMNHMTTLTDIKPGLFRLWTLKFVLWLINLLAKTVFIVGDLGGIPTIHFARWVFIDGDRRLLFFSNYDGSWESYMGDFIDRANQGLTSIWGNTVDFPRTRWLAWEGARRVDEFKRWTRVHNVFNQVWYAAYPDQTIRNITRSIKFREGLTGEMNDQEIQAWLRLL